MELVIALQRTLLLMRDEFGGSISDEALLHALVGTRVALVADNKNINSHSAQVAFVTTAMLMARSGHQVSIIAPNVEMLGPQPPLKPGLLVDELMAVGEVLLPGIRFHKGPPESEIDLAIGIGNTPITVTASRKVSLNCEAWAGILAIETDASVWLNREWPIGALAAAALGAGEAFKVSIHKLIADAVSPENTSARFAYSSNVRFELAPHDTLLNPNFGKIDFISGGAITNAVLYCLARLPNATGNGRLFEPDSAKLSNLNRYMLLLRSKCGQAKAVDLADMVGACFDLKPIAERFDALTARAKGSLAPTVITGVDHIPSRWVVQQAGPRWHAIGATTHWSAMASYHTSDSACARCLHPTDEVGDGPIPTTALVSFWAGLSVAAYIARKTANSVIPKTEQQVFLSPFRPESPFRANVARRPDCPICQAKGLIT